LIKTGVVIGLVVVWMDAIL